MKAEIKTQIICKISKTDKQFMKQRGNLSKRELAKRRLEFLMKGEITTPRPPKPSPIPPDGKKKPGRKKK